MKKYLILLCVLFAFLLAACQSETPKNNPADNTENTPVPTQTTQPTEAPNNTLNPEPSTAPTTAPTQPASNQSSRYNFFKFDGSQPYFYKEIDISQCTVDHLYAYDKEEDRVEVVFDGPVVARDVHNEQLFFVKAAEPTKLYSATVHNYTAHTVIYESNYGPIVKVVSVPDNDMNDKAITLVEDNKRFVYLDLATKEAEVILEKPYFQLIYVDTLKKDTTKPAESWRDYTRIFFEGSLVEGGEIKQYLYFWETGKIEETHRL